MIPGPAIEARRWRRGRKSRREAAKAGGGDGKFACNQSYPTGSGKTVPRFDKAGRGGFMRRFLTLVCLLCLAIPAGISISGCYRNPGANYCNGLGYGMKITDVASISFSQPLATTGISHGLGQTRTLGSPSVLNLQGRGGQRRLDHLRHHQQPVGGHLADRQYLRRHLEPEHGRRHRRLHHLQPAESIAFHRRPALRHGLYHGLRPVGSLQSGGGVRACPGDLGQPCHDLSGTASSASRRTQRPRSTRRLALQATTPSRSSVRAAFGAPANLCLPWGTACRA